MGEARRPPPSVSTAPIVTFLSDFGLRDPFVGLCHAVIAQIAPGVTVVDLTHDVRPHDVRHGAHLLVDCVPIVPRGVHLAVVDPGVGSARSPVVLAAASGALLVGPDNGLLPAAAEALGGVTGAWELAEPAYRREYVSRTFHGRDVFAPAAAHLALGTDPAQLGPPVSTGDLARVPLATWGRHDGAFICEVRDVDVFGNIQLAIRASAFAQGGVVRGGQVVVSWGGRQLTARYAEAFADVGHGHLAVLEDSFGWLAVACNGGSAAAMLGVGPGDAVSLAGLGPAAAQPPPGA